MRMSVIFKSDAMELRLTFWGYASRSAMRANPAAAAPMPRNLRRPIVLPFVDMTLLFATRTDSRFATGSLYPDYLYEPTFPKQMLARPEVPSWQQYNFAGSMTMVFASGVGPGAVRRRRDAVCTERVPANRKLGALWLGLCIIAESFIEQSGQIMGLLRSDPVKRLKVSLSVTSPPRSSASPAIYR
jgi:hypothetical protein